MWSPRNELQGPVVERSLSSSRSRKNFLNCSILNRFRNLGLLIYAPDKTNYGYDRRGSSIMLKFEIFNMLEGTSDAAFTVSDLGEVCS